MKVVLLTWWVDHYEVVLRSGQITMKVVSLAWWVDHYEGGVSTMVDRSLQRWF